MVSMLYSIFHIASIENLISITYRAGWNRNRKKKKKKREKYMALWEVKHGNCNECEYALVKYFAPKAHYFAPWDHYFAHWCAKRPFSLCGNGAQTRFLHACVKKKAFPFPNRNDKLLSQRVSSSIALSFLRSSQYPTHLLSCSFTLSVRPLDHSFTLPLLRFPTFLLFHTLVRCPPPPPPPATLRINCAFALFLFYRLSCSFTLAPLLLFHSSAQLHFRSRNIQYFGSPTLLLSIRFPALPILLLPVVSLLCCYRFSTPLFIPFSTLLLFHTL